MLGVLIAAAAALFLLFFMGQPPTLNREVTGGTYCRCLQGA